MRDIGIYIHIPFCKKKCLYCDFVSFEHKEYLQDKYIKALKMEIENWKEKNDDINITTIYIGGGTPSYLDSKYIKEILNIFEKQSSITIEINPGTVDENKLCDYKKIGIDRISIGLQSTKNELLKKIGRIHTYEDFLNTYTLARKIGFNNINVDLMIGLPEQTIVDIKDSLEKIIELDPEHISVYSLIIEDDTPIKKLVENNIYTIPDDETERQMYWYVKDYLELKGYKHYEISNFAKSGFESRHNVDCWEQKEYIGFGVAAHSYFENKRFCNETNIEQYINNCLNKSFDSNIIIQEIQDKEIKMKEYMILGLRKLDGISIQKFEYRFNENPIMLFREQFEKLCEKRLLYIDGDKIKLTNKGLDLANIVWEEFI